MWGAGGSANLRYGNVKIGKGGGGGYAEAIFPVTPGEHLVIHPGSGHWGHNAYGGHLSRVQRAGVVVDPDYPPPFQYTLIAAGGGGAGGTALKVGNGSCSFAAGEGGGGGGAKGTDGTPANSKGGGGGLLTAGGSGGLGTTGSGDPGVVYNGGRGGDPSSGWGGNGWYGGGGGGGYWNKPCPTGGSTYAGGGGGGGASFAPFGLTLAGNGVLPGNFGDPDRTLGAPPGVDPGMGGIWLGSGDPGNRLAQQGRVVLYWPGEGVGASTIQFQSASFSATEANNANVTLTLTRTGDVTYAASADVVTSDVTAVAGADYTATSVTVPFPAGATTATLLVPVLNDTLAEPVESFLVDIVAVQGNNVAIGQTPQASGDIVDDDGGTFFFTAASYTVTENVNTGKVKVTVKRSGGLAGGVTIAYSTADGTATAGLDYVATSGILSFSQGQVTAFFEVPVINDTIPEGKESFMVNIAMPNLGGLGSPSTATVYITDNENAFTVEFASYTVVEGTGNINLTLNVLRSGATGGSSYVDYATSDVTAVAGQDYTPKANRLTFTTGQVSKLVTITIIGDTVVEPAETFLFTLSNPKAGWFLGNVPEAVVTIQDND